MKVTVHKTTPVCVWTWPQLEAADVCGICREEFEKTCPACWRPGAACPPITGDCSHSFHKHCIEKWLRQYSTENSCPMCRQVFSVANVEMDIDNESWEGSGSDRSSTDQPRDLTSIWNSDSGQ